MIYAKLLAIEPGDKTEKDGKLPEDKPSRSYVVQPADGSKRRYRKGGSPTKDDIETHDFKWLLYDFFGRWASKSLTSTRCNSRCDSPFLTSRS